ncbi:hypothetical protein GCM10010193_39120 [Kitasatospora atroaurantiaca]|uniref:hypothetical protein n=1 Tax=Kitasatospora atroaurantiaca TaxID=285545 RepID=UPI001BA47257|nr:hypothetical protein [Kitasatospora atroaurantiaca]
MGLGQLLLHRHQERDPLRQGRGGRRRGLAVSVGQNADAKYGRPRLTDEACVADWDSTGYTAGPVHCLRRTVATARSMYGDQAAATVRQAFAARQIPGL